MRSCSLSPRKAKQSKRRKVEEKRGKKKQVKKERKKKERKRKMWAKKEEKAQGETLRKQGRPKKQEKGKTGRAPTTYGYVYLGRSSVVKLT